MKKVKQPLNKSLGVYYVIYIAAVFGVFISAAIAADPPPLSMEADPDANFEARCSGSGVSKCLGFDDRDDLEGNAGAEIDTDEAASGAGSMYCDIPGGADGMGLAHISTDIGASYGEGSSMYMQWRQRFTEEYATGNLGGQGMKQWVLYERSPADIEVAMLNDGYMGFPQLYTQAGAYYMNKKIDGETAYQFTANGEMICGDKSTDNCKKYVGDQWMTFYYVQKIGNFNQDNSTVELYMAAEGEPLEQVLYIDDWNFIPNGATAFKAIWLGPFTMGNRGSGNPDAGTWFDEFIVSSEPIADPYTGGASICEDPDALNNGEEGECEYEPCCRTLDMANTDLNCKNHQDDVCEVSIKGIAHRNTARISISAEEVFITSPGAHRFEVVNVSGETVYAESGASSVKYSLSNLNMGIYFVNASAGDYKETARIFIR